MLASSCLERQQHQCCMGFSFISLKQHARIKQDQARYGKVSHGYVEGMQELVAGFAALKRSSTSRNLVIFVLPVFHFKDCS
jgi:hypothetical protein